MDQHLKVKRFCATPKTVLQVSKFLKCSRQWARALILQNCKETGETTTKTPKGRSRGGRPGNLYKTAGRIPPPKTETPSIPSITGGTTL